MPLKIGMIALGCAKNVINSEQMLWLLENAGMELAEDLEGTDVVVINTCGFIQSAKEEAIAQILEVAELKKAGLTKKILVAGCLAQRYKEEILAELPEVDGILGCGSFAEIVEAVQEVMAGGRPVRFWDINQPDCEAGRVVTSPEAWAYIKIAEGCDNRCAYCVIPSIRGRYRSRPMENILEEAQDLVGSGAKELIVVAQDITRYGTDLYGGRKLSQLLRELCKIDGLQWIRLHYLYPDAIDDELIDTIAEEEKIQKYLDIPIQHINDKILKAMNRRGTGEEIRALFQKLRQRIPNLVLRTSLITGLPGEGEAEFEELCAFLKEAQIQRVGVFPFSPEEGTPAAAIPGRPDEETAQCRAEQIMDLQEGVMEAFSRSRIGKTEDILCEDFDEDAGMWYGRSYADSPEIDGRVYIQGAEALPGEMISVEITGLYDGDLIGVRL